MGTLTLTHHNVGPNEPKHEVFLSFQPQCVASHLDQESGSLHSQHWLPLLFKMGCYTLGPLDFADLVFNMGTVILVWGAQAGLDLLVKTSGCGSFCLFT